MASQLNKQPRHSWLLQCLCLQLAFVPLTICESDDSFASGQCQQRGETGSIVASWGSSLLQAIGTRSEKQSRHPPTLAELSVVHDDQIMEDRLGSRYAHLEQQVQNLNSQGIAVVIPGLGTEERAAQVEKNLNWLNYQGVPYECFLYVYKTEEEFPITPGRFSPCQIIRHPGFWMSHVLAMPLNMTRMQWVLHMMDGIEPQADINLTRIFQTMVINQLGHVAPTFPRNGSYQAYYSLMYQNESTPVGRMVDFIELHFDVFSRQYFACLQDILDVNNTLGWGVDRLLPSLCGGAVSGSQVNAGSLGLMDQMTMQKHVPTTYDHGAAGQQMNDFFGKHPEASTPLYLTIRELL
jgi:hypothetical protein